MRDLCLSQRERNSTRLATHQQTIGHEFNVLCHQLGIHADEIHRKCVCDEFLLDVNCLLDNFRHLRLIDASKRESIHTLSLLEKTRRGEQSPSSTNLPSKRKKVTGVSGDIKEDTTHQLLRDWVLQQAEQQASEIRVHALIARDQLIREGQARHEASLLQPENGAKGAREENALQAQPQRREEGGESRGKRKVRTRVRD